MTVSEKYLLCVTADNHNKYYRMIPNGNSFTVEYGRVEANPQTATYPMSAWDKKYNEKIRKGYKDVTEYHSVATIKSSSQKVDGKDYKQIADVNIRKLVDMLLAYADKTVAENYNVSVNLVTQAMIDGADSVLDDLTKVLSQFENNKISGAQCISRCNDLLADRLFVIIPRKMRQVTDWLVNISCSSDKKDIVHAVRKVIQRETDLLDVLRTKVVQTVQLQTLTQTGNNSKQTILDAAGITIAPCDADDIVRIKKALGEISGKFYAAWKVTNKRTQDAFDDFKEKYRGNYKRFPTKLLWHGSRNQNWWSILNSGLKIRPNGVVLTGAMFGNGIYFADKARKSLGYTSLRGSYWASGSDNKAFMALYDVAYGKPYDVYQHDSRYYSFDWQRLQNAQRGSHCLHAHAGKSLYNDEIIVYKPEQVTVRYLVELRN